MKPISKEQGKEAWSLPLLICPVVVFQPLNSIQKKDKKQKKGFNEESLLKQKWIYL